MWNLDNRENEIKHLRIDEIKLRGFYSRLRIKRDLPCSTAELNFLFIFLDNLVTLVTVGTEIDR